MKIKLKTGLGYLKDKKTGKIVSKFDLPPGEHEFDTTNYDIVEVPSKTELDTVQVEPEISPEEQIRMQLVNLREQIIEKLVEGDTTNLTALQSEYKKVKSRLLR